MSSDPTISQLRVFLAAVNTGRFMAASIEMNLTQSAVSHAVQQLERALDARLFERNGRGVRLTDAGRRALPIIRHLLDEVERLKLETSVDAPPVGTVRIASFPSLALHIMPTVLTRVRVHYPGIEVVLRDAYLERPSVEAAVLRAEADIGLTQLPADPHLLARAVLTDPFELLMPTEWDPTTIWERPYIHLGSPDDDFVIQGLRQLGVHIRPSLCLMTEPAIVALVNQRLGFAILPTLALQELPEGVKRLPAPAALTRTLGTVTRPGELSVAGRCVLKLIWTCAGLLKHHGSDHSSS